MKDYVNVLVDMDDAMVHLPGNVHATTLCERELTTFMSVPMAKLLPSALDNLCERCFTRQPTGSYV